MRPPRNGLLLLSCGLSYAHRVLPIVNRPGILSPRLPIAQLCTSPSEELSINPLDDASLPCRSLAFYLLTAVDDPEAAVQRHRNFLAAHAMVGRVYIHATGINAQVSGTTSDCLAYRQLVVSEFPGKVPLFKEDPVAEPTFPRLRVKHKALVPDVAGGVDLKQRGEDVEPEQWAAMLGDTAQQKLVLDVRNQYEWDVGHFEGAARPQGVAHFSDSDAEAFGLPSDPRSKEETPVMMYCTGGIRCEYFSAALKQQGYQKVYKLKGGVQHYANRLGEQAEGDVPHWKGSLFVFDRRNTVALGGGQAEVVGKCHHCGVPTESFINCCNVDCNLLHLVCEDCLRKYKGFCQPSCASAPRRRLLDLTLASEGEGDEGKPLDLRQVLATTQGPAPNERDVNRLSAIKPHNVGRAEFDVDKHLLRRDDEK